ncbi:hypothetical protein DICVIV_01872 [Dictyocaulus viviparus]|uniref:Uncharacterized protein n=1 Tax=Dictyocaulus viviparus TaxID=29172 RepID=A0A0D8YBP0_DICVI|nr:hypothetical protein DICVIV_01872 [Dictyocaulus viviparus]
MTGSFYAKAASQNVFGANKGLYVGSVALKKIHKSFKFVLAAPELTTYRSRLDAFTDDSLFGFKNPSTNPTAILNEPILVML